MLINPNRGKRIFAFLMIFAGVGIVAGLVKEMIQARYRTKITEAYILNYQQTMSGIGPVRQYSIQTKYEFFVDGIRFEKQQSVDSLPSGAVYVRYDPQQPSNNALDLASSTSHILGVMAGIAIIIGAVLAWHTWKPIAFLKPTDTSNTGIR